MRNNKQVKQKSQVTCSYRCAA